MMDLVLGVNIKDFDHLIMRAGNNESIVRGDS